MAVHSPRSQMEVGKLACLEEVLVAGNSVAGVESLVQLGS